METPTSTSAFLHLPRELRYKIYDYLCLPLPLSYPYKPPSPISSVSTRGPSISLLLTSRTILEEICTYYFTRCTFRLVAQSFVRRPSTITSSSLSIVRRAKRIEILLLPGTMRASSSSPPGTLLAVKQMTSHWLDEQVRLLKEEATELEIVVVSMRRVSWNHDWSVRFEMEALLRPLEGLKGRVDFRVGEVIGPAGVEEEMRRELGGVLGRLNVRFRV